jgi:hypothetical protein
MIGVALETTFPPRQPVQKLTAAPPSTSGALRGFLLEPGTQPGKTVPAAANVATLPALAFAGVTLPPAKAGGFLSLPGERQLAHV